MAQFDEVKETSLRGTVVKGYIGYSERENNKFPSLGDFDLPEEGFEYDAHYLYVRPEDCLDLNVNKVRGQVHIYEVEAVSNSDKMQYSESRDRAYYECDKVKVIRELSREEIIFGANYDGEKSVNITDYHMGRVIAFYDLTAEESLKYAEMIEAHPGVIDNIYQQLQKYNYNEIDALNKINDQIMKSVEEEKYRNETQEIYNKSFENIFTRK